jgi:hypothetical protein
MMDEFLFATLKEKSKAIPIAYPSNIKDTKYIAHWS